MAVVLCLAGAVLLIRYMTAPKPRDPLANALLDDRGAPPSDFTPAALPATGTTQAQAPPSSPPVADPIADARKDALASGLYAIANNNRGGGTRATRAPNGDPAEGAPGSDDPLSAALRPTQLNGVRVTEGPDPNFTVGAGRLITCKQQVQFNSTAPGGVTAVVDRDVWSETGKLRLIDKGSTLIGTAAHGLGNGLDRVFVLWQTIRTEPLYDQYGIPHQYDVAVNSPATEENGANGLAGDVNRHLPMKLGGVFAISLVQGLTGAISNIGSSSGGTTNNIFPSFGQGASSAADIWIQRMIDIPDVLTRLEGQQCGVLLLRDVDMHGAYKLVSKYGSR